MAKKILTQVHEIIRLKHYGLRTEKKNIFPDENKLGVKRPLDV